MKSEIEKQGNNNIKLERYMQHQQPPRSDELRVFEGVDGIENDAAES